MSLIHSRAKEVREALRPQVHNDDRVLNLIADVPDDDPSLQEKIGQLKAMCERATGSINNSYLKVQISTALVIGLIALMVALRQIPGVNKPLLMSGAVLCALAIGISLSITTPRATIWVETITEPGAYVIRRTKKQELLYWSRHAFHNRVVLLRNRRLAWLATWLFTFPGFALAMLAWAPMGTGCGLIVLPLMYWLYRQLSGKPPSRRPKVYPGL